MDFGSQMSAAARLAASCPQVGEELRRRYRVVLLDEYQDTGHAQRIALSSLFGRGADAGLALTAVGDPIQSIYGWRGASATNLPRFTTDFPQADGSPAPTLELRTSWRNPPSTLHIANAVSAEARRRSVAVRALRSRPGAEPGTVKCALLADVAAERDWVADHIAARYAEAAAAGGPPPTAAVLVRRNADAAPMAEALSALGVPVEVVGLAGLLSIPEVADLVAMLRLVADPAAGSAAMRVLTGPRWRLGARDIAALWRRAAPSTVHGRWPRPPSRSSPRRPPTPTPPAWPTRWPIPARRAPTRRTATCASPTWPPNWPAARAFWATRSPTWSPRSGEFSGSTSRCARRGRSRRGLDRGRAPGPVRRRRRRLRAPARRDRRRAAGVPGGRGGRRERPRARRRQRRGGPRADPHRARGQGPGVAGGGRPASVRPGVSVHGVQAHLAVRPRRPAAAAARRPRGRGTARRAGAGHLLGQRPKGIVRQHHRPPRPARAATHRRGAPASLRGDHPRRGHPADVRPPLGRHRVQTARPLGLPLRGQGHHRPRRRGGPAVRGGRALGADPRRR